MYCYYNQICDTQISINVYYYFFDCRSFIIIENLDEIFRFTTQMIRIRYYKNF